MQICRHPKIFLGIGQAYPQFIVCAEPFVGFQQSNELPKNLGNIGAIDLVYDQNVGWRRSMIF